MNHYRGKSKHTNEWINGDLIESKGKSYIVNGVVEANSEYITIENWQEVNPKSVGQFTGMEVNGVKLYDKMKFKYFGNTFTVNWSVDSLSWVAFYSKESVVILLSEFDFKFKYIEIIQD